MDKGLLVMPYTSETNFGNTILQSRMIPALNEQKAYDATRDPAVGGEEMPAYRLKNYFNINN